MSDDFYAGMGGGDKYPAWSWANADKSDKPPGTTLIGTIKGRFKFEDKKSGNPRLGYHLETSAGMLTLFVGQWKLEKELVELRPDVNDKVKITFTGIDPDDGQSKLFTVELKKGEPPADEFYEAPQVAGEDFSEEPF